MATSNPFAHLQGPVDETPKNQGDDILTDGKTAEMPVCLPEKGETRDSCSDEISQKAKETQAIDRIIQRVFLVTIDDDGETHQGDMPTSCVFLVDMAAQHSEKHGDGWSWLDWELVESALFERLLLPEPAFHVISMDNSERPTKDSASQEKVLLYLLESYHRCKMLLKTSQEEDINYIKKCEHIVVSNTVTSLITPEVYQQNIHQQALDVLLNTPTNLDCEEVTQFFHEVASVLDQDEDFSVSDAFTPILQLLQARMNPAKSSLSDPINYAFCDVLQLFAGSAPLAEVLVNFMLPAHPQLAKSYELNPFGYILSLSCTPTPGKTEDYFEKPSAKSQQERQATTDYLWKLISELNKKMHLIFKAILKSSTENRNKLLFWIGTCLDANKARVKLWSRQALDFRLKYCSNEFFINLAAVLLRLCAPFCKLGSNGIVSVDLSYCKVPVKADTTEKEMSQMGIHTRGLDEETKLIKIEEEELLPGERPTQQYKFVTDIFFLTQQCLHIGFHVLLEDFYALNRQLHQLQEAYRDASASGGGATGNPLIARLHEEMEKSMSRFLSTRTALLEPAFIENGLNFHISAASLLNHLLTSPSDNSTLTMPTLPLPEKAPDILAMTPEVIAENAIEFWMFLRRFNEQKLEDAGESLSHIMTFVIVFMGNKKFMNNPHLRAKLAEVLEGLLPISDAPNRSNVAIYHRERMFKEHLLDKQLSHAVLSIFVDIEFTGDEHQFEQKFNYRRPMYKIIKYLWGLQKHRECFKILAHEAVESIESYPPPLFLQFVNLLVNDAIFMLDEAMTHLKSIREHEIKKEQGELNGLPLQELQQRERQVRTSTAIARFFNVMSRESVACLAYITEEIKDLFTHPIMVERIAGMFNDFLLKLVGKRSAELKVRDFSKLEFNPGQLVHDICQVYINLGEKEGFCRAVAQDGRSYNSTLFSKAERVLIKIRTPLEVYEQLKQFSSRVKEFADKQEKEEETFADAPDDFMDPVTYTLMTDPVILPSSGVTVDRSVISRHLLSDHTDPFNRAPLTMDQVKPNTELKKKIDEWKEEQKRKGL